MKRTLLFLVLATVVSFSFAQNLRRLRIGEVYDFAVGDTFQYIGSPNIHSIGDNPPIYRQVTVLSKTIDNTTIPNDFSLIYTLQIEEYTASYRVGPRIIPAEYTKTTETLTKTDLGGVFYPSDVTNSYEPCPVIANPTDNWYCYDSTVLAYGNRKTFKHEYNRQNITRSKLHFAAGLGMTLDELASENQGTQKSFKMVFYHKKDQIWGDRLVEFDKQEENIKPLTTGEAFDFAIGDTFQYKTQNSFFGRRFGCIESTEYAQQVITDKWYNLNKDTVFYTIKQGFEEPFVLSTIAYTLLDSLVEYRQRLACPLTNNNDYSQCFDERGTENNRKFTIFKYNGLARSETKYVAGLGEVSHSFSSDVRCNTRSKELVYFKSGNKEWGIPVLVPSNRPRRLLSAEKINLSPNPTSDILNIETDIPFFETHIVNLNGQVVLKELNSNQINVSQLANGIYFLQVFENSILRGVKKVIVNH